MEEDQQHPQQYFAYATMLGSERPRSLVMFRLPRAFGLGQVQQQFEVEDDKSCFAKLPYQPSSDYLRNGQGDWTKTFFAKGGPMKELYLSDGLDSGRFRTDDRGRLKLEPLPGAVPEEEFLVVNRLLVGSDRQKLPGTKVELSRHDFYWMWKPAHYKGSAFELSGTSPALDPRLLVRVVRIVSIVYSPPRFDGDDQCGYFVSLRYIESLVRISSLVDCFERSAVFRCMSAKFQAVDFVGETGPLGLYCRPARDLGPFRFSDGYIDTKIGTGLSYKLVTLETETPEFEFGLGWPDPALRAFLETGTMGRVHFDSSGSDIYGVGYDALGLPRFCRRERRRLSEVGPTLAIRVDYIALAPLTFDGLYCALYLKAAQDDGIGLSLPTSWLEETEGFLEKIIFPLYDSHSVSPVAAAADDAAAAAAASP